MQQILWATSSDAPSADKKIQQLEKKLSHYMGKAIAEYQMIQPNDRVLVCVSGGKDSLTMLMLLEQLRKRSRLKFELLAFTLDQSQPGWDDSALRAFYQGHHIPYVILKKDTYSVVKEKIPEGKTYCSLCSRLRRGNIYHYAKQHGFNKIALGHHRDDLIASLMMSIMYNGEIRTMPPKLLTDDKQNIVIRPLSFCQEKDIASLAKLKQYPIIPCNLCGSQENLARKKVRRWLDVMTQDNPKIPSNMLRALQKVKVSQLMDKTLWNFKQLESQQQSTPVLSQGLE